LTPELRGIRLRRLQLAGSSSSGRRYGVSFMSSSDDTRRSISIIAGPSQTGKTSVVEFVLYCLGGREHPQHPEIIANVRAALLECELATDLLTVERSATGAPSRFASIWNKPLGELRDAQEIRLGVEPTSDPGGLSQFVLARCGLDNVELPEAPTSRESETDVLSVRDLFKIMWLPNDRLDNKNLTFEQASYIVRQKFRQTIDVIFDVHDAAGVTLAARARHASEAAREATRVAESLKEIVRAEYPLGELVLETDKARAQDDVASLSRQLEALDRGQSSAENTLIELRRNLEAAQFAARDWAVRVRDRESLIERLAALRGQYADDKRKLSFLKDAERLFDPLQVTVCPACLSALKELPSVTGGHCSLCGNDVLAEDGELTLGAVIDDAESGSDEFASDADISEMPDASAILDAEHRAASHRLSELTDYWTRLTEDLKALQAAREEADRRVADTAAVLDQAVSLPAPYVARRDDLSQRRADAMLREQTADAGLRLWRRVAVAEENASRLLGQAASLRAEQRENLARPARATIIRALSQRFGEILSEIGYPKLSQPYIDEDLVPFVRGLKYTAASSGGLVLISIAYYLSIWELAYERSARAPGLLLLDSPQKNLGTWAHPDDADFADIRLVENFYRHTRRWLAGPGSGAQLVIIDNSPPDSMSADVVVRYTRNPDVPPYGLIDNETD
jgi:hypothetical protein